MKKHIRWLLSEIDQWVADGIIDTAIAQSIRSRYPIPSSSLSWGKIIFSSLGAILFGLGIILFFAYNWEKMHKSAKLGVIFLSLITAHGAGIWFHRTESSYKPAGEGLHVLGTMIFGAGIWLIAQIYHINEHYPNAFFIWGIGALSLAWAMPSVSQGIIASLLLLLWNGFEVFDFWDANHFCPILILCGIIPLAWWLRSRVLIVVATISYLIALGFTCSRVEGELVIPVLFFCACILIAISLILRKKNLFPESAPVFGFLGYLLYLAILYIMSFKGVGKELADLDFQNKAVMLYFVIFASGSVGLWIFAGILIYKDKMISHILIPIALICFILRLTLLSELRKWAGAAPFNILFLTHSILMIYQGCKTTNVRITTIGCLLFSLLAITRYVDLFDSLLMRSAVFFIIGAGIFIVGNFYSKTKRRIQESEDRS